MRQARILASLWPPSYLPRRRELCCLSPIPHPPLGLVVTGKPGRYQHVPKTSKPECKPWRKNSRSIGNVGLADYSKVLVNVCSGSQTIKTDVPRSLRQWTSNEAKQKKRILINFKLRFIPRSLHSASFPPNKSQFDYVRMSCTIDGVSVWSMWVCPLRLKFYGCSRRMSCERWMCRSNCRSVKAARLNLRCILNEPYWAPCECY